MLLVRTVYVSAVANGKDSAALPQIMKVAQASNEVHNLTGMLVFSHKYYLQVLEGGRKAFNGLLNNLYRDLRRVGMMALGFLRDMHGVAFAKSAA